MPTDNIDTSFARAAAHRFTSETLKARYQALGIFEAGEPFYKHTSHCPGHPGCLSGLRVSHY
jgi:hypothetical protein